MEMIWDKDPLVQAVMEQYGDALTAISEMEDLLRRLAIRQEGGFNTGIPRRLLEASRETVRAAVDQMLANWMDKQAELKEKK